MNAQPSTTAQVAVKTTLVVGEVDGDSAVLSATDLSVIRLPLALLPPNVAEGACVHQNPPTQLSLPLRETACDCLFTGHVIEMHLTRSAAAEHEREVDIRGLQAELRARLGPAPMRKSAHEALYDPSALLS